MTAREIEETLRRELQADPVMVEDESGLHRGHAGATGGGHYRVLIVAQCFAPLSRIERHKKVYAVFAGRIGKEVHALALRTLTPEEYRAQTR